MKKQMESLVDEMLDGRLLLSEAIDEFEKIFIERALDRNDHHISRTADMLGLHRNTVAKRIASYNGNLRTNRKNKDPRQKRR
ncbi:MAG: hypothetical protein DWQ47_01720 [Acidobacteria bacterium]|nr:MAG: hypothetical protein DWQ32_05270 [Acidobacteriota bacterium]REK01143.1 MAG: hypothetical protein DWQ38_01705 [Acidobacteriota bacterium]REK14099.1 MAG: hypothetical protein DWQ43_10960 [Acidobacteriota bacterium]REK44814.1 MAG: hypothetical protein DWQ47_01720 [Acidobacteriota bacterium]